MIRFSYTAKGSLTQMCLENGHSIHLTSSLMIFSLRSFLLAVIIPNFQVIKTWAKSNLPEDEQVSSFSSLFPYAGISYSLLAQDQMEEQLCENEHVKSQILRDIQHLATAAGLMSWEVPRVTRYISPVVLLQTKEIISTPGNHFG